MVFDRHDIVYDARDQVISEKSRQRQTNGKWHIAHTINNYTRFVRGGPAVTELAGAGTVGLSDGSVLYYSATKNWLTSSAYQGLVYGGTQSNNPADFDFKDANSSYRYDVREIQGAGAGLRQVGHVLNNPYGSSTSTSRYDRTDGALEKVSVEGSRGHTVEYRTDGAGRILQMKDSAGPASRTYMFGGQLMGEIGNDGTANTGYAATIAEREAAGDRAEPSPWRGSTFNVHADFDLQYRSLASTAQANGSSYVARGGESLAGVAAAIWGDAQLWYRLADANGLSAGAVLAAGQTLRVPAGVQANRHNADTFRPYDPSSALGNTSPTTPQPQKQGNKCGALGAVLLAVVAVAVTVWATPGATAFFSTTLGLGSTVSAVAGGAVAGAAGSAASQTVGVASGIQESFSWKGVAMGALGGAVGGGLANANLLGSGSAFARVASDVAAGALGSAVTQGIGVATGLQNKFSWAGVAAAGVGAGVGGALGRTFGEGRGAFGARVAMATASGLANAATRSAIEGSSFGKAVIAAIPDAIGQAVGGALGSEVLAYGRRSRSEGRLAYDNPGFDDSVTSGPVAIQRPGAQMAEAPTAIEHATAGERVAAALGGTPDRDTPLGPLGSSQDESYAGPVNRMSRMGRNAEAEMKIAEGNISSEIFEAPAEIRMAVTRYILANGKNTSPSTISDMLDVYADANIANGNWGIPSSDYAAWQDVIDIALKTRQPVGNFNFVQHTSLGAVSATAGSLLNSPGGAAAIGYFGVADSQLDGILSRDHGTAYKAGTYTGYAAAALSLGVAARKVGSHSIDKLSGIQTNEGTLYNSITGVGPLGADIGRTFRSSSYTEIITQNDTVLFRSFGGNADAIGPYWTRVKPEGPLQAMIDSALDPAWGNTATEVAQIKVPRGVKIYEGATAPQQGLIGGGNQVFVPRVEDWWVVK